MTDTAVCAHCKEKVYRHKGETKWYHVRSSNSLCFINGNAVAEAEPSTAVPEAPTAPIPENLKGIYGSALQNDAKPWAEMMLRPRVVISLIERIARAEAATAELKNILSDALDGFKCTQNPKDYGADHWTNRFARATRKES